MKAILSQVLIIIIMIAYSVPVYTNDKRVKSIYENYQKFKKSLRYLRLTEQILTHDEEMSSTIVTDNPIIPITTTPIVVIYFQIATFGNIETQEVYETSELATIKITYTIIVYYTMVPISKVITMTIKVYEWNEEINLLPEDKEITCNLNGNETSADSHSYDCSGEIKLEVVGITNVTICTNEEIKMEERPGIEYENIRPLSITIIKEYDLIANSATNLILTDGQVIYILENTNSFIIEGTIINFNHNPDDIFTFIFTHFNDRTNKSVECKVDSQIEKVDDTKSKVTLECGPYYGFLNTTLENAIGTFKGTPKDTITLVMAENSGSSLLLNYPESTDSLTNYIESSNSTDFNSKTTPEDDKSNKVGIIIGIIGGVILISIIIIVIIYCKCRKKESPSEGQNNNGSNVSNESDSKYNVTSLTNGSKNTKGGDVSSKTSTSN